MPALHTDSLTPLGAASLVTCVLFTAYCFGDQSDEMWLCLWVEPLPSPGICVSASGRAQRPLYTSKNPKPLWRSMTRSQCCRIRRTPGGNITRRGWIPLGRRSRSDCLRGIVSRVSAQSPLHIRQPPSHRPRRLHPSGTSATRMEPNRTH